MIGFCSKGDNDWHGTDLGGVGEALHTYAFFLFPGGEKRAT